MRPGAPRQSAPRRETSYVHTPLHTRARQGTFETMEPSAFKGVREASVPYRKLPLRLAPIAVFGVDFSGARRAGDATWVAHLDPLGAGRYRVHSLERLGDLAPSTHRRTALRALVALIADSPRNSLWALEPRWRWPSVVSHVANWRRGAYGYGLWCVRRSVRRTGALHTYRLTDRETKAPFDPFHYRIIYQTFHAIRDVVLPLREAGAVAVMPFDHMHLSTRPRVLVETCPSSTLQRLGLPHQLYKAPRGATTRVERRTRERILAGLSAWIELPRESLRVVMQDPGGDALDAVIAGVGAAQAWGTADLASIAAHPRYRREGFRFA